MIKASDIMMTPPLCVSPETRIAEAVDLLLQHEISGLPVVDCDGRLVGMFSETDQFKARLCDRENAPVSTRMTKHPITVTAEASVLEVAKGFRERTVHRMPVTADDGQVVGVIGCRDLTQTIRDLEHLVQELHQTVPRSPVPACASSDNPAIWCNVD